MTIQNRVIIHKTVVMVELVCPRLNMAMLLILILHVNKNVVVNIHCINVNQAPPIPDFYLYCFTFLSSNESYLLIADLLIIIIIIIVCLLYVLPEVMHRIPQSIVNTLALPWGVISQIYLS